jgi:hypothetical protein
MRYTRFLLARSGRETPRHRCQPEPAAGTVLGTVRLRLVPDGTLTQVKGDRGHGYWSPRAETERQRREDAVEQLDQAA